MVMVAMATDVKKNPAEAYLAKYAESAVIEMHRSQVPASITLAQAILESGYGRSELAIKANNHFGIHANSTWKGDIYSGTDAGVPTDFRKYDSVLESYHDHSLFLKQPRYSDLYKLRITDYKGWAKGLQKAGYAQDPEYSKKLIRIIEQYELYKYDEMVPEDFTPVFQSSEEPVIQEQEQAQEKEQPRSRRERRKERVEKKSDHVVKLPEPVQEVQLKEVRKYGVYRYNLSRQMFSSNGVAFVYSIEGETYESIAKQYNLFVRELLRYNDLKMPRELEPGTIVYLAPKKLKVAGKPGIYVAEKGVTLWDVSQKFAIKLKRLCKINDYDRDHVLREGDEVILD